MNTEDKVVLVRCSRPLSMSNDERKVIGGCILISNCNSFETFVDFWDISKRKKERERKIESYIVFWNSVYLRVQKLQNAAQFSSAYVWLVKQIRGPKSLQSLLTSRHKFCVVDGVRVDVTIGKGVELGVVDGDVVVVVVAVVVVVVAKCHMHIKYTPILHTSYIV